MGVRGCPRNERYQTRKQEVFISFPCQWIQAEEGLSPVQGAGEGWNSRWHRRADTGQGLCKTPSPFTHSHQVGQQDRLRPCWCKRRGAEGQEPLAGARWHIQVCPAGIDTKPGARTSCSPQQEQWSTRLHAGGWHPRTVGTEGPGAPVSSPADSNNTHPARATPLHSTLSLPPSALLSSCLGDSGGIVKVVEPSHGR